MIQHHPIEDQTLQQPVPAKDALALVAEELQAVPETALRRINLDIPRAVTRVLGIYAHLKKFRAEILGMPGFQARHLDSLGVYAHAARAAHNRWMAQEPLPASGRRRQLKKVLAGWRVDLRPLVQRGVIGGGLLKTRRGQAKDLWIGFAILALAEVIRQNWAELSSCTCITFAEVDAAAISAQLLLDGDPEREAHQTAVSEATLVRAKAYHLFFRAYDQVRRAMTHIRWDEGDVDELAPSLHRQREGRSQAGQEGLARKEKE